MGHGFPEVPCHIHKGSPIINNRMHRRTETTLKKNKIPLRQKHNFSQINVFIRGKAISGAPSINGTNQFPKPPIKIGITINKNYYESTSSCECQTRFFRK